MKTSRTTQVRTINVNAKRITFVPAGMTGNRLKAIKINNLLNS